MRVVVGGCARKSHVGRQSIFALIGAVWTGGRGHGYTAAADITIRCQPVALKKYVDRFSILLPPLMDSVTFIWYSTLFAWILVSFSRFYNRLGVKWNLLCFSVPRCGIFRRTKRCSRIQKAHFECWNFDVVISVHKKNTIGTFLVLWYLIRTLDLHCNLMMYPFYLQGHEQSG